MMIKVFKKIFKKTPIYPLFLKIKLEKKKKIIINDWLKKGKPAPPPHFVKQGVVKEYAKKFSITILIETGTYLGEMISAVKDVFDEIYSIELDIDLFTNAKKKFANIKNVHISQGDSSEALPELLTLIEQPCLFWLDGHYSGVITAKGDLNTPILNELKSIFSHKIKDHVILIDDARCFTGEEDYPTIKALKEFVIKNRPDGVFEIKDDIIRIHKHLPKNISKSKLKSKKTKNIF